MQDDPISSVSAEERNHISNQLSSFLSMIIVRAQGLPGPEANREAATQANRIESNSFANAATASAYRDDMMAKISTLRRKLGISDNTQQETMQEAPTGNRQMMDVSESYGDPSMRDPRSAPTAQQHTEMFQQHTRAAQSKGLGSSSGDYGSHMGMNHMQTMSQGQQSHQQQALHPQHQDTSGQRYSQPVYQQQEIHSSMRVMPGANGPMNYSHVSSQPNQAQAQMHRQIMATQAKRTAPTANGLIGLQQSSVSHAPRSLATNQQGTHPGTVKLGTNSQATMTQGAPGTTSFARGPVAQTSSTGMYSGQVSHNQHPGMRQVPYHPIQGMNAGMNQDMGNSSNHMQPMHNHMPNATGAPAAQHQPPSHHMQHTNASAPSGTNGANPPNRRMIPSAFPPATLKAKWAILAEQMPKVSNLPAQWKVLGQKYHPDADPMTDLTPDDLHALISFADLHAKQEFQRRSQVQQQQQQQQLQQQQQHSAVNMNRHPNAPPTNPGAVKGSYNPPMSSTSMGIPASASMSNADHSNMASSHLVTMAPGVPLAARSAGTGSVASQNMMGHNEMHGGPHAGAQMTHPAGSHNVHTATNLPPAGMAKGAQPRYRQPGAPPSQPMSTHPATSGSASAASNGAILATGTMTQGPSAQSATNQAARNPNPVIAGAPATATSTAGQPASAASSSTNPAQAASQNSARAASAPVQPGAAASILVTMPLEKARETLLSVLPVLRELSRIRTLSSKVREFLGGFTPSPIDQLPSLLPDTPWWERPKRKWPTDNTKSGDGHLISANIVQLKRSKLKEANAMSIPHTANPNPSINPASSGISVHSDTDSAFIRTMREAQGLRDEISLLCGTDHFFSLQHLQMDLALIKPSVSPFCGYLPAECDACCGTSSHESMNSLDGFAEHPPHHSHAFDSGVEECCSCPSHLFAHSPPRRKPNPNCTLGLLLDIRYPQAQTAGEIGLPPVVPHFSVRGCHFGKTFAHSLHRFNMEVKPTLNPRQYVKLVLERWKSWLQALSRMEAELRNPIFHNVTFRETARQISVLTPSHRSTSSQSGVTHLSSLSNRQTGSNGSLGPKRRSISYIKANSKSELEFGVTFSLEGAPDFFLVLPIDYPVSTIEIIGIDTNDLEMKQKLFNARSLTQSRTISELLHTWIAISQWSA